MAIIRAPEGTDVGQALLQAMMARQQNEIRKEDLKLRQQQFKLDQEQQQAQQQQQAAQEQAAAQSVIQNVRSPDEELAQMVGGLPEVQAFLSQLGNANVPAGQSMAAAIPANLGQVGPGNVLQGGAKQAVAGLQAERAAKQQLAVLRKNLTKEEFTVAESAMGLDRLGLESSTVNNILAAQFPESQLQAVQREKAQLEIDAAGDENAADLAATAYFKQRGFYPEDFPDMVPGAADMFNTFREIDKRTAATEGEGKIKDEREAIKFVGQLAASYTKGSSDLLQAMGIDVPATGPLDPAEATQKAIEVAVRTGMMSPELAGTLNTAQVLDRLDIERGVAEWSSAINSGEATFTEMRRQLRESGAAPAVIQEIMRRVSDRTR